jgi:hypothetical protein
MKRAFVIFGFASYWLVVASGAEEPPAAPEKGTEVAPGVLQIGTISNRRITESSGVVASRQYPGLLWTHNDGGGPRKQILFALRREGESLAEFRVTGALLHDWEDIAIDDEKHLFVGDIGNNDAKRTQLAVYQIDEPDPKSSSSAVIVTRGWQLRFAGAPFDCESLFVWRGQGYVISKVFKDRRAEIYRFPLQAQKEPAVLEWVARLPIDSPVTGADISADGKRLGVVCKAGAYVFRLKGADVSRAASAKFHYTKFRHEHIEGCCFVPDGLLATAESREIYLFTDAAFRPKD